MKISRGIITTFGAVVLCCAAAAPAGAATLSYQGDRLVYTAAPHESNGVIITPADGDYLCPREVGSPCVTVTDTFAPVQSLTPDCIANTYFFSCSTPAAVVANLGDYDDSFTGSDEPDIVDAGPGNDVNIYGNGGNDTLSGGDGNDVLYGGEGDDALDGGKGNDSLEGIPGDLLSAPSSGGSDTYSGGGGDDSLIYANRTEDLSLSLDGVANDGADGEHDNIGVDIATVYGGNGNDTLTGSAGDNVLYGDVGDDVIAGGDGDDALYGGTGADLIDGGPGGDYLEGDSGDDTLAGGPDVDQFYGESPLAEGTGRDEIFAADGLSERIGCGPGIDVAHVDSVDVLLNYPAIQDACEDVDAAQGGAGGGGGHGPDAGGGQQPGGGGVAQQPSAGAFVVTTAKGTKTGVISLRLSAPVAGKVTVAATAKDGRKSIKVGSASGRATAAGAVSVSVKPTAAAKRALKKHGLRVSLRIVFTPAAGGAATTLKRAVALRRR